MFVALDSIIGDTITTIKLRIEDNELDTISCSLSMTADIVHEIIFDNKAGLISRCDYAWGDDCVTIVGSRINGILSGNISLQIDDMPYLSQLNMYPNPANDIIMFKSKFNMSKSNFSIYSYDGKLVKKASGESSEIEISDLSPGLYLVKNKSQYGSFYGKFTKQ